MNTDARNDIFYVIGSLEIGGTERHLSLIAPELVKRGFAVTVYNLTGVGSLAREMAEAGVSINGPPISCHPTYPKIIKLVLLGLSSLKLFSIFLFQRPTIVHFFLPQAYLIGGILAKCAGLPRLIMSRRSLNEYQKSHPWLSRLEKRLHKHMQAILGNSRRVVDQLRVDEHVPKHKLGLLYNGVRLDPSYVANGNREKREELALKPTTVVLVIVANLIAYKGHSDLLESLGQIKKEMPRDWCLLVIGRDDGIGEQLKKQAKKNGIQDHVNFMGARDNVPEFFRIADLALLTSHEEGFSNVILEAMAAGLPVVATDVGGNGEAVIHNQTGLIVPPHSPTKLGRAIVSLARDATLRKCMGQAGRERVQSNFSLEASVSRYEDLYNAILYDKPLPMCLKIDGMGSNKSG